jgi:sarcosine oxidase, subunit alpha
MKFSFNGREIEGNAGDTIASALYRQGQRIFSRSFKYHRPRGLLCCAGNCPNCLMNVDGIPNIRTCITPARPGMIVRHQNAYPSLDTDWMSASQRFDWLMPVGWYYKTFTHHRLWHAAEPWIRKAAGLGEILPCTLREYEHAWMHTETAVIGGGSAGVAAALRAAERGERVVLVDNEPELGGRTRYSKHEVPRESITKLQSLSNVQVFSPAQCFGLYEGNLVAVLYPNPHPGAAERLIHLRARKVTIATGAYETPLLFANNDLPGVMLSSAVQRLYRLHGVVPGLRAVIVGDQYRAEEVAADLRESGMTLVARVAPDDALTAIGKDSVKGIRTRDGSFVCDLIVVCGPLVPDSGLAAQAGAKLLWDEERGAFLPTDLPANVSVVGRACGETLNRVASIHPAGKRAFVCLCGDVSSSDLCNGIAEGFDHIETLKRYTTTTMGPCQGRMCQLSAIKICASETDRKIAETGVTTSRPPNPSITLGALAGPRHHPIRRTPMHYAHEELGAAWMDMGDWKRPRYYRTSSDSTEWKCVQQEYRCVREGVGLIDVSTLGKLDLRGSDVGKLLDKVYTHRFSDLRPGRVRYALMCDEGGVILDDGTVSRISDERYFVTTTTGNLDFVNQWLEWYLIGTGWDVHIANVTGGYGAMNIAGPKAREVLGKVTECDLSSKSFPYMACKQVLIDRVPSILLRIGFVGETGWEIHCPAECAEAVWRVLLESGRDAGIRPFGVEAQRLLRLEKRHVIVGVDTDALTNPFQAGMGWTTKLDKEDFVGKAELSRAAISAPRELLVGFVLPGSDVPPDGAAIVTLGKPVGRVTSSRYSPWKKAVVGLAWVTPEKAEEGATIQVRVNGKLAEGLVTMQAFYDPEGTRLRQ